jgi:hypothetical protein
MHYISNVCVCVCVCVCVLLGNAEILKLHAFSFETILCNVFA